MVCYEKILGKSTKQLPRHFLRNDKQIDKPEEIANEFNLYFINSCNQAINTMLHDDNNIHFTDYLKEPNSNSLFFSH